MLDYREMGCALSSERKCEFPIQMQPIRYNSLAINDPTDDELDDYNIWFKGIQEFEELYPLMTDDYL
jgi:hypothetical protein